MIAFEERKFKGLTTREKINLMEKLMSDGHEVCVGTCEYGAIRSTDEKGKIQKMTSGVWGYEGDAIAVYVNEQPYPSTAIIELNCNENF